MMQNIIAHQPSGDNEYRAWEMREAAHNLQGGCEDCWWSGPLVWFWRCWVGGARGKVMMDDCRTMYSPVIFWELCIRYLHLVDERWCSASSAACTYRFKNTRSPYLLRLTQRSHRYVIVRSSTLQRSSTNCTCNSLEGIIKKEKYPPKKPLNTSRNSTATPLMLVIAILRIRGDLEVNQRWSRGLNQDI